MTLALNPGLFRIILNIITAPEGISLQELFLLYQILTWFSSRSLLRFSIADVTQYKLETHAISLCDLRRLRVVQLHSRFSVFMVKDNKRNPASVFKKAANGIPARLIEEILPPDIKTLPETGSVAPGQLY